MAMGFTFCVSCLLTVTNAGTLDMSSARIEGMVETW